MRTILPANRDFYTDFVTRQAQFSVQYVHNGRLSLVLLKTRTGILGTPSGKAARCFGLERSGPRFGRMTLCLEDKPGNAILMLVLGSAYFMSHRFARYLGLVGPKLDPTS